MYLLANIFKADIVNKQTKKKDFEKCIFEKPIVQFKSISTAKWIFKQF